MIPLTYRRYSPYFKLKSYFKTKVVQSNNHSCIPRCTAGVLFIPVTVIKTRFESGVYSYNGIFQALGIIFDCFLEYGEGGGGSDKTIEDKLMYIFNFDKQNSLSVDSN